MENGSRCDAYPHGYAIVNVDADIDSKSIVDTHSDTDTYSDTHRNADSFPYSRTVV